MARKKPKRKKHQVKKKPGVTSGTTSPESGPNALEKKQLKTISSVSGVVLDVILLVLALVLVIKLIGYAGEAKFFTDECFHNYIINLTVENGRIPGFLPDIYSGEGNVQPPLFHSLGTVFQKLFGEGSLRYLNIFFLFAILITMYILIRVFINANTARFSLLFIMSSPFIHEFSLMLYLEILSGLTFFLALFLLLVALERKRYSSYIWAGLAGMTVLISKITGISILPFYFICFIYCVIRYMMKKERLIAVTGPVIMVATCLAASMIFFVVATDEPPAFAQRTLIRPVRMFVLPNIFGEGDDRDQLTDKDGKKIIKPKEFWSSFPKKRILRETRKNSGNLLIAGLIIALIHTIVRLGRSRTLWIFIYFIYAFLVFLYNPGVAPRHFIALLPLAAFLGGYALNELGEIISGLIFKEDLGRGLQIIRAVGTIGATCFIILFVFDVLAVKAMPNYRTGLLNGKHVEGVYPRNISPYLLESVEFIRDNTPEDSLVFTMWAYSTLYHSGRAATWGANAKGLKDIYFIENPEELYKRCMDAGITHFLIDANRIFPDKAYNTVVFTTTIVKNLVELIKSGKAEMMWPTPISSKKPDLVNGLTLGALPYGDRGRFEIFVKTPEGTARFITKSGRLTDYYVIKLNYNSEDDKGSGEEE